MNFEKNIYGRVLFFKVAGLFLFESINTFLSEPFSNNETIAFVRSKNLSSLWDFLMSEPFEKEMIPESFQINPFSKSFLIRKFKKKWLIIRSINIFDE